MTQEQLQKLDAMAKPRSEEAIKKAEERKKKRLNMNYEQKKDELFAAPHWISVEDELPKHCGEVLVLYADNEIGIAFNVYDEGESYWVHVPARMEKCGKVTHWMELPAPPRKEEKL